MYCKECGYSLKKLIDSECPECGHRFDIRDPTSFARHRRIWPLLNWLALGCACYPLLWLLTLYAAGIAASWRLGRWPQPNRDDPGDFDGTVQALLIVFGCGFLAYLPVLVASGIVLLLLTEYSDRGAGRAMRWLITMVALWICTAVVTKRDPARLLEWYFD
jgi:hypothetical protein